jgi:hypothetical protein
MFVFDRIGSSMFEISACAVGRRKYLLVRDRQFSDLPAHCGAGAVAVPDAIPNRVRIARR